MQLEIGFAGGTATPESGYRPEAYQQHFRELWNKKLQLKNNSQKECQQLKKQINDEIRMHKITGAPQRGTSNHTRGTAFDIVISGVSSGQLNAFARNCGLTRASVQHGHGHHFNFVGVPRSPGQYW